MKNKKVVLAGRNTLGVECLHHLISEIPRENLAVVPTNFKSKDLSQKDIKKEANNLGIRIFEGNINNLGFTPDIIFSILYDQRFKEKLLESSKCINLHFSPLPKYGGVNPFYWAIVNGETQYGVTLHEMDIEFDTGKIIGQRFFSISHQDTARQLAEKSYREASILFKESLCTILDNSYIPIKQDLSKKTYYSKKDVNFDKPLELSNVTTEKAYNLIRARFFPPTILIEGEKYKILSASPSDLEVKRHKFTSRNSVFIKTKDGSLEAKIKKLN